MPIQNDDQARQAAELARRIGADHPRYGELVTELRRYSSQGQQAEGQAQIAAADEPVAPAGPGQQQFDDSGEVVGPSRGRADQIQLSERDQQQIANLQELARTDPSQMASAQEQIRGIRQRASGEIPSLGRQAVNLAAGTGDVLGALASSAWREPVSGFMGMYRFAATSGSFRDRLDAAAGQIRDFQEQGAKIDSEEAQEFVATVTKPLQWFDEGAREISAGIGGGVAKIAGEEAGIATSTALYTAALMAPELFGLKTATGRQATRTARNTARGQARQRIENFARGEAEFDQAGNLVRRHSGDLELSPAAWQGRLRERAESMGGEAGRGRNLTSAVDELQADRAAAEGRMAAAWADAEDAGQLRYYTANMESWAAGQRRRMVNEGQDLREMPKVQRFLDDMEQVGRLNPLDQSDRPIAAQHGLPQSLADIRELEAMNGRLNQYIRSADSSEFAMLNRLKTELNTTIDSQIDRGLMSGDPAVHQAYKNAREVSTQYYSRFNSDQVISRLAHMEADATQMRNWLLGASDSLPPASIHQTLDRIAELPNGANMLEAVKMETTRGLLQPLLRTEPNYGQFVEGVRRFKERYPDVFDRMDFNMQGIDDLAKFTDVLARHGGTGMLTGLDPSSLVARFWVGHGIARKAAKVNLFARVLRSMTGSLFGNSSRRMWNDLMNQMTDGTIAPDRPLFDMGPSGAMMAVTADGLQNMGVEPERARELADDAVTRLPEIQANIAAHNEAVQSNPEVPVENPNNPGDGYDVMADARRFAQTGVRGQSIAADLMVQENAPEVTQWTGMVHPDPVHGMNVPTIGFGTNLQQLPKAHMERMGWSDADVMAMMRGDKGISQEEGIKLMQMRLVDNELVLRNEGGPMYRDAPQHVKRALRNLAYNMGTDKALNFGPRYRAALERGDYREAAQELLRGRDPRFRSEYVDDVKEDRARFVASQLAGVPPSQIKIPPPKPRN
jgi:GH24 family phage-related lysozyme (muramidase)